MTWGRSACGPPVHQGHGDMTHNFSFISNFFIGYNYYLKLSVAIRWLSQIILKMKLIIRWFSWNNLEIKLINLLDVLVELFSKWMQLIISRINSPCASPCNLNHPYHFLAKPLVNRLMKFTSTIFRTELLIVNLLASFVYTIYSV